MTANADIFSTDGERRHDQLCPLMEDEVEGPLHLYECLCDLIAKVRKDERDNCVRAIRARRDALVEQIAPRQEQTRSLASAIYEDSIATLRLLGKDKPISTVTW